MNPNDKSSGSASLFLVSFVYNVYVVCVNYRYTGSEYEQVCRVTRVLVYDLFLRFGFVIGSTLLLFSGVDTVESMHTSLHSKPVTITSSLKGA